MILTKLHQDNISLIDELKNLKIDAYSIPLFSISALEFNLNSLDKDIEVIIFISKNAIKYFFESIQAEQLDNIRSVKFAVIGDSSFKKLLDFGIGEERIIKPKKEPFNASNLYSELSNKQFKKILIVKGQGGLDYLKEYLISDNIEVLELEIYKRQITQKYSDELVRLYSNSINLIVFITCNTSVDSLIDIINSKKLNMQKFNLIVASKRIESYASNKGLKVAKVLQGASNKDIIDYITLMGNNKMDKIDASCK